MFRSSRAFLLFSHKDFITEARESIAVQTRYDHEIDLSVENNSHTQLILQVPHGVRVLDLGCATGRVARVLVEQRACRVTGVDQDASALEAAARWCERTLNLDLDAPGWAEALGEARFDVILMADVVEHVRDPEALLRDAAGLLAGPDAVVLASIPNGVHAAIRLEVLEGRLTYEDEGLLDRTHLHFFTHDSVRALFARAGWVVEALTYTFHDLSDEIIVERLRRVGLEAGERALARFHAPDAVAYQFVVRGRRPAPGEVAPVVRELHDFPLQGSMEYLRNLLAELQGTREVARNRAEVIEQQRLRLQELEAERSMRAQLESRLAVLERRVTEYERRLDDRQWANIRLSNALRGLAGEYNAQRAERHDLALRLTEVLTSRGWRLWMGATFPLRLRRELGHRWRASGGRLEALAEVWCDRRSLARPALPVLGEVHADPYYGRWIEVVEGELWPAPKRIAELADAANGPLISVLMPVHDPHPAHLQAAIDSVRSQSYGNWQLCILDDASVSPEVQRVLREAAAADSRIDMRRRERAGHISVATNEALAMAKGQVVAFLDHDDMLSCHALFYVAEVFARDPEVRMVYSDEDKIDDAGQRFAPYFKPDLNPDLLTAHNYICHLVAYSRSLLTSLGGLREGFEGAQDHDLALRALQVLEPPQIRHIPRILYHWRLTERSTSAGLAAKPYALEAGRRALQSFVGDKGQVEESGLLPGAFRVRYHLPEPAPLVSIIIPTRNHPGLLRQCVEGIFARTDYPRYEILVVDNGSDEPAALDYLRRLAADARVRVLSYPHPFNYSRINNFAVSQSEAPLICLLNDDVEVISRGWLTEMASQALRPEIGAVGACLWYPDDRLQHGGVVIGIGGVAGHAFKFLPKGAPGANGRALLVQNYSAVTAAALVMRREVFDAAGGFEEEALTVAFNDVDLCLRIGELGYRNLWTPYAELYHHESSSRGYEDTPEKQARFQGEIEYMLRHWTGVIEHDPAYNPNFTRLSEDFALSFDVAQILGSGS